MSLQHFTPSLNQPRARNPTNDLQFTKSERNRIKYLANLLAFVVYDDNPIESLSQHSRHHFDKENTFFCPGTKRYPEGYVIGIEGSTAYVAFCGTNLQNKKHLEQMQRIHMKGIHTDSRFKGMEGYVEAMLEVELDLSNLVLSGINHVVLSGHSRGGAIAFLKLAQHFTSPTTDINSAVYIEAIAFGSPVVFNETLVTELKAKNVSNYFLTVASEEDIVPGIIWAFGNADQNFVETVVNEIMCVGGVPIAGGKYLLARYFGFISMDLKEIPTIQQYLCQYQAVGIYEFFGPNDGTVKDANYSQLFVQNLLEKFSKTYNKTHVIEDLLEAHSCKTYVAAMYQQTEDFEKQLSRVDIVPKIHDLSGQIFLSDKGNMNVLSVTFYGHNLQFLGRHCNGKFKDQNVTFKVFRADYSVAQASCKFNQTFELEDTFSIDFSCPFAVLPTENIQNAYQFFSMSPTLESNLRRVYRIHQLLQFLKENDAKRLDFPLSSGWGDAEFALKSLEQECDPSPNIHTISKIDEAERFCKNVVDVLLAEESYETKASASIKTAMFTGGVMWFGYFFNAVGATIICVTMVFTALVQFLMGSSDSKDMVSIARTMAYEACVEKVYILVTEKTDRHQNYEDALATWVQEQQNLERALSSRFTSKSVYSLRKRIKCILWVRDIRLFTEKVQIVGFLGTEQVGKTTTVRRLFRHVAEGITEKEKIKNTIMPIPYQDGLSFIIDFPGVGGDNKFGEFTHLYGEICQAVVVILGPHFGYQSYERSLLDNVLKIKVRTLVLRHRWGEKANENNYSDTKNILQNHQNIYKDFTFRITEFEPKLWEEHGYWLKEKNVWDIRSIRQWIRTNTVIQSKLDDMMPDSNAIWEKSLTDSDSRTGTWIDNITPAQIFWGSKRLQDGVSDSSSKELFDAFKKLRGDSINDIALIQFEYLKQLSILKDEFGLAFNIHSCMAVLEKCDGSLTSKFMIAFKNLRGHGVSDIDLIQFDYLVELNTMKDLLVADFNIEECIAALKTVKGNIRKAYNLMDSEP